MHLAGIVQFNRMLRPSSVSVFTRLQPEAETEGSAHNNYKSTNKATSQTQSSYAKTANHKPKQASIGFAVIAKSLSLSIISNPLLSNCRDFQRLQTRIAPYCSHLTRSSHLSENCENRSAKETSRAGIVPQKGQ